MRADLTMDYFRQFSTRYGRLFVLYLICHCGLLFLHSSLFWDDWVIYGAPDHSTLELFRQLGSMFNLMGWLHVTLLKFGPIGYRLIVFLAMFLAGVFLDQVLRKLLFIDPNDRFLIVLFFLVLPFNWARATLITAPYTICYLMFFWGWSVIESHRIISLALFFLSFNTNSTLVFYLLPIVYLGIIKNTELKLKSLSMFCIRKLDYITLPIAFFTIKQLYYQPFGLYHNYNQSFSLNNVLMSSFYTFVDLFKVDVNMTIAFVSFLLLSAFQLTRTTFKPKESHRHRQLWIITGVCVCLIACLPYWIVARSPQFEDWSSRHQLLMPLGTSFVLVGLIKFFSKWGHNVLINTVTAVCIAMNLSAYHSLYIDWQKQQSLIQAIRSNQNLKSSNLLIFYDGTKHLNAFNRTYRHYEWSSIVAKAFGERTRLAIDYSELNNLQLKEQKKYFLAPDQGAEDFNQSSTIKAEMIFIGLENVEVRGLERLYAFFRESTGTFDFKIKTAKETGISVFSR
jgi:hypothetical protein